jgi:oligoendopeptidase F
MEEPTTTESASAGDGGAINGVAVDSQGRALEETTPEAPQPETTETQPAESEPTESSSDKSWDDDTVAWAEKKGIDLNDPEGIQKAVQSYREAEKQLHKTSQERSDLKKVVESGEFTQPIDDTEAALLRSELEQMKLENKVNSFWTQNPDAKEYEDSMVELLSERPHLASDLEALFALAKVKSGDDKRAGGKEALEKLATKQKASIVTGAATQSASAEQGITPQNVDALVGTHDHAWYMKNRDAINKAMEG